MVLESTLLALASLGDLDGDGVSDLAVQTPNEVLVVSTARHRAILRIPRPGGAPEPSAWRCDTALSRVGDLDGDGRDDLVLSWASPERGRPGRVQIHSTRDGRALLSLEGRDGFGRALAGPGDLDGDGLPDFLVGIPALAHGTGAVEARSGKDGTVLHTVRGEIRWSSFGCSIVPLGDLDGDGRGDYAVGAPGPGNSGPEQEGPQPFDAEHAFGAVHVISGGTGERIRILHGASYLPEHGRGFGAVLASGQDFDRDGDQDLVVGQGDGLSGSTQAQHVVVLSGKSGALLRIITREGSAADLFGFSLAALPDLSADGIPDLLVGSPEWNLGDRPAETRLVQDVGSSEVVSGADGSSLRIRTGERAFERSGIRVTSCGDLVCVGSDHGIVLVSGKTGTALWTMSLDSLVATAGR